MRGSRPSATKPPAKPAIAERSEATNGTLLNGKTINQEFLQDGDKFEVGDQLIRFEMLDEIGPRIPATDSPAAGP